MNTSVMSRNAPTQVLVSPRASGGLEALRQRVLSLAIGVAAVAAPTVAGVFILGAFLEGTLRQITWILSAYTLQFPLLFVFSRLLGYRATGALYLAGMVGMGLIIALRGGVGAAPIALQLVAIVLAGVLFGVRGVGWTLAGTLASFAIASVAVIGEWVIPIATPIWDPTLPGVWIRAAIILTLFGGGAAVGITHVLSTLDAEAAQLRQSLERERLEQEARARAESESQAARAALEEAQQVEAIGRLAGGVAHDYNNALTVILAAAEAIRADPGLDRASLACADDIIDTAFQSAELTRSLLALGRRDASQPAPIEVAPLLRQLSSRLGRTLPEGVRLRVGTLDPCAVFADASQLERVLTNLVLNARDAVLPAGEIELSSRITEIEPDAHGLAGGPHVAIRVRDTGHGMSAEVKSRLFEPFFSTKSLDQGSGIGMSLVRTFITDVKGGVDVQSEPGRGTTITLFLPEHLPAAQPEPAASVRVSEAGLAAKLSTADRTAQRGIRPSSAWILLVDSDTQVIAAMARVLQGAGFGVRIATTSDAALELLADVRIQIDLLCFDASIQGVDSEALVERALALRPDLPLLLCAGSVDGRSLRSRIRDGTLVCLQKPFSSAQFIEAVRDRLEHKG